MESIRATIDHPPLGPREGLRSLHVIPYGLLANIFAVCVRAENPNGAEIAEPTQLAMVAGIGFELVMAIVCIPHASWHNDGKLLRRNGERPETIFGALDHSDAKSSLRYQDVVREATNAARTGNDRNTRGERTAGAQFEYVEIVG
jgi:hypothetical protein